MKRASYFAYPLLTPPAKDVSSWLFSDIYIWCIFPGMLVKDPHKIWLTQCEASLASQVERSLSLRTFSHSHNMRSHALGSAREQRCKHTRIICGALSWNGDSSLISPRITQRDTWKTLQFHCGERQGHLRAKAQSDKKSNLGVMEQRWNSRSWGRKGI